MAHRIDKHHTHKEHTSRDRVCSHSLINVNASICPRHRTENGKVLLFFFLVRYIGINGEELTLLKHTNKCSHNQATYSIINKTVDDLGVIKYVQVC